MQLIRNVFAWVGKVFHTLGYNDVVKQMMMMTFPFMMMMILFKM